jgi:acetyltransferase-like isoleucine patch superfamily enzyme
MKRLRCLFYKYFTGRFIDRVYYTKKLFYSPNIKIGEQTYGRPKVYYKDSGSRLVIGNYCSISEEVKIFLGGNHKVDWVSTYPFSKFDNIFENASSLKGHPATKGDIIIGNDVWIGYGVTILSGVTIGDGAVIAANSSVARNVNSYEIVAGNPAKAIRKRFDESTIDALLRISWWNWDEKKIVQNLPLICSNAIEAFLQENQ